MIAFAASRAGGTRPRVMWILLTMLGAVAVYFAWPGEPDSPRNGTATAPVVEAPDRADPVDADRRAAEPSRRSAVRTAPARNRTAKDRPRRGGLRVRLHDEKSRPVSTRRIRLVLEAFATDARRQAVGRRLVLRANEAGIARTAKIAPGLFLRITARPKDRTSLHKPVVIDIDGPRYPGDTTTCNLLWRSDRDPKSSYPVVTGRFVRRTGRPWSRTELRTFLAIFPMPRRFSPNPKITVGQDGRFRYVLRVACPPGGRRICRVYAPADDQGIAECRIDLSERYGPGETDLGDIVLDRGRLFAAGSVVDQTGKPVAGVRVWLCQRVRGNHGDLWPTVDCSGTRASREDGRFALYHIPGLALPEGELRVRVPAATGNGSGAFSGTEVPVRIGERNIRVEVQRRGSLAGTVILASGQTREDIVIRLEHGSNRFGITLRKDGSFLRGALPLGPFRLTAWLRGLSPADRAATQVVVDGLRVVPGQTCRDPRIQNLIIRGHPNKVQLLIVDASSKPVPRARVEIAGARVARSDSKGRVTLRPRTLPVDVVTTAFGFRTTRTPGIAGPRTIVLKRGLLVRLTTKAVPIGDDPAYHLGGFIYHVKAGGQRGPRAYGDAVPYDRIYFDAEGRMTLRLPRPGTYEVQPWIYVSGRDNVGRGGYPKLKRLPRFTVVERPALQEFAVEIPAAAVKTAVDSIARR